MCLGTHRIPSDPTQDQGKNTRKVSAWPLRMPGDEGIQFQLSRMRAVGEDVGGLLETKAKQVCARGLG